MTTTRSFVAGGRRPFRATALSASLLAGWALSGAATAQTVLPIPLENNFNGIVHAGESGDPDAPNGFRSISDRALDFTLGVPDHPLLSGYELVDAAGQLDIVHIGNRDLVNGGAFAFDDVDDTDTIGLAPGWLTSVDQSGDQVTVIEPPLDIPVGVKSNVQFLFQVSNGGGAFEVVFDFANGFSIPVPFDGPDWFGGDFAGTDNVDLGVAGGNLGINEGTFDVSFFAGSALTQVAFRGLDNDDGALAILGMKMESGPAASNTFRNAGTNPASYNTETPPVLGSTFTGTVDLAGTTGHSITLLVGFATADEILLPTGQTILVNPFDPAGELLGLQTLSGPIATFQVEIPDDISFAGFTLSTQALHAGGAPSFAFSNAYDHVLGV